MEKENKYGVVVVLERKIEFFDGFSTFSKAYRFMKEKLLSYLKDDLGFEKEDIRDEKNITWGIEDYSAWCDSGGYDYNATVVPINKKKTGEN